jgi:hypothetical protein
LKTKETHEKGAKISAHPRGQKMVPISAHPVHLFGGVYSVENVDLLLKLMAMNVNRYVQITLILK